MFYILTCQACSQASDNVSAETFQARTKTRLDKFGQSHDECRYLSSGAWVLQHRIRESAMSSLQTNIVLKILQSPLCAMCPTSCAKMFKDVRIRSEVAWSEQHTLTQSILPTCGPFTGSLVPCVSHKLLKCQDHHGGCQGQQLWGWLTAATRGRWVAPGPSQRPHASQALAARAAPPARRMAWHRRCWRPHRPQRPCRRHPTPDHEKGWSPHSKLWHCHHQTLEHRRRQRHCWRGRNWRLLQCRRSLQSW